VRSGSDGHGPSLPGRRLGKDSAESVRSSTEAPRQRQE
jgi:hypothetical protein